MAKKLNVLLFPLWHEEQWNQGRTFQKVAEQLSRTRHIRRVICVFPARQPENLYSLPVKVTRISSKLRLITTYNRCVPTDRPPYRIRRWLNAHIGWWQKLVILMLGVRSNNTILWYFPPLIQSAQLNNYFPSRMCITQIVDNFLPLDGDAELPLQSAAVEQYPQLAAQSDLVIAGSHTMLEYFSSRNTNTILMENAVDIDFIGTASELPHRTNGGKPRLGYVGFISARTDIELLEYIAINRPDWQLVIAGPIHEINAATVHSLSELANVDYLGSVPYEQLPGVISSFDVCLIPHKDTPLSRSMSPLKYFQYLGSGRPIVCTPIAGLERFGQHTLIGHTSVEFVAQIQAALTNTTLESSSRQIEAAKNETWEARIADLFKSVLSRLGELSRS